jgi:two-component system, OmpR family, sensor kinase
MSLATRVSGFFLAALALALIGFSTTLYLLARSHFQRDLDERLVTALDVLSGSAKVTPGRVEWEPLARPMIKSTTPQEDPVCWVVSDGQAKVLENSWPDLTNEDIVRVLSLSPDFGHNHGTFVDRAGRHWRLAVQGIPAAPSSASPPDRDENKRDEIEEESEEGQSSMSSLDGSPSLILGAGAPSEPMEISLRNVALTLAGVSIAIWLLAALVGRRVCDRALSPVTRMAKVACSMTAANRDLRLPSPQTGDELDALANSFNGLLDRLHQEFERQKRFTGDASHQLRTPITALLGQLEVARRRERTVAEYQQVLDQVHGEARRLGQIVESLLFMARAENEAGRPDLKPLELVSWLREHYSAWSSRERGGDLSLEIELEPPVWVNVHAHLLGQLLDNLVDNACKYSSTGSPIHVRLWRGGTMVALAVEDHGFGLSAEDLPHVFEPFYRSSASRRRGVTGVGLGLAVVERIAWVFGGSITAESEPGQWTRFVLRLNEATEPRSVRDHAEPSLAMS